MSNLPPSETKPHHILRLAHLWLGVGLLLPLVALGLSGTILTFGDGIAAMTNSNGYVTTAAGDPRPLGELLAAARPAAPEGSAPSMIVMPEDQTQPTIVRFQRRGASGPGGIHQILLDPVTLQVFSSGPFAGDGIMRFIHRLHGNLLIDGGTGREIVGYLGIVMCALGVSGLALWWPKSKPLLAAFTVARGARGFRLHRDLHGALGIWSWLVFVVVSFSGVYIAFPQATGDLIRLAFPARDLRTNANAYAVEPIRDAQPISIDEAAALALAAAPGTRVWTARFPSRPDQPYRFGLIRPGHAHGQPAVLIAVDPWKSAVIEVLDPKTFTAGETIMAWQRGVHAGEGLGWVWKILVALSGLLPLIFGFTGIAMWRTRRRVRRRIAHRAVTQEARP